MTKGNMTPPKPSEPRHRGRFERVHQPWIVRAGVVCLGLIVALQVLGVLSRHESGYAMLGVVAVLLLVLAVARRLSDD